MDPLEYYGLVVYQARAKYAQLQEAGVQIELDDLIQEGFLGLLDALRRFDASRGVSFSTFAYPRIAGAIDDYLRRQDFISQVRRAEQKQVESVRARLAQSLGREPLTGELAETLAISEERVERAAQGAPSFAPEGWDLGQTQAAVLSDLEENRLLALAVDHCLHQALEPPERQVLLLRVRDEFTLKDTSEIVGRPLQTVFNVEQRARRKMRDCLEGQGWGLADEGS